MQPYVLAAAVRRLVAGVSGHVGIMTVEAVGRDARINRRVMLASRQLSNSPPQLLCIWFAVDILELAFTATRDVFTVCIIDLCVCLCLHCFVHLHGVL